MVKHGFLLLQCWGKVLLIISLIGACNPRSTDLESLPPRKFIHPTSIHPQIVQSSWHFETIFSPYRFDIAGQDWLAIDSKGHPALAYGGSQLNYAWFDGVTWQMETVDSRPGSGKFAHLLFDANDQPYIVYFTGGLDGRSLDTLHRDPQGWHYQMVDFGYDLGNIDAILDGQGNLVIAYELWTYPNSSYYGGPQLRVAHQLENKWQISFQISTFSQQSTVPSLALDREKYLHLGYWNNGWLVETLYQPDGTWQEQGKVIPPYYFSLDVSNLLVDKNLQPHFIYCSWIENDTESACMQYHIWLTENGWQTEQIGPIGSLDMPSSVVMDSADRIYLLTGKDRPKLLRRDAEGWQELYILDDEIRYSRPSLILDRNDQVHAAYFKRSDYTIHYAVKQNGVLQNQIVDQGNEPYWSSPSDSVPSVVVYDRRGELHIAHYDAQGNVHYRSKYASGWQDESIAHIRYLANPCLIELIFDLENQPHVFYQDRSTTAQGDIILLKHAFLMNGNWVNEDVPFNLDEESYERSPVVIDHKGRLSFLETQFNVALLRYRTADGWSSQILEDFYSNAYPVQIAFAQETSSRSISSNTSLPKIFYFDGKANTLMLDAPGEDQHLVVPILRESDRPIRIAMRQNGPDSATFLVVVESSFRYAIYQRTRWQVYELSGLHSPAISAQSIGSDGTVHLVFSDGEYRESAPYYSEPYYMEGNGSTWKKTLVTGFSGLPFEMVLSGTAVDWNGGFCLLLTDIRANSLILGCLETID